MNKIYLFVIAVLMVACNRRNFNTNSETLANTLPPIYQNDSVLTAVEIKAPVKEMMENKMEKDRIFKGTIRLFETDFNVDLEFKGDGRRLGCKLPSIKIKFKEKEAATKFFGDDGINLTTDCEIIDSPTDGFKVKKDLESSEFAYREWFGYKISEAFGIPTFRTRLAEIKFTDIKDNTSTFRKVYFIERPKAIGKRLNVKVEDDDAPTTEKEDESLARKNLIKENILRASFAEILVSNVDWGILRIAGSMNSFGSGRYRNTKILHFSDGLQKALIHDFDLSVIVRGMNPNFLPEEGDISDPKTSMYERVMVNNLRILKRDFFVGTDFKKVVTDLRFKRANLQSILNASPIGKNGKAEIQNLMDGFYVTLQKQKVETFGK